MDVDLRDLDWQRRYEESDTPWDRGAPAPPLVKFLREGGVSGRVLVPGCGLGHDARALALAPGVSVVGLDLAPAAIARANVLTQARMPTAEISFVTGDFFKLPRKLQRSFDWIVEHTCFCAIDPARRPDYVRAAAAALRTDGRIFAIFYLDPRSESAPPFPVSREELDALFGPHFELLEEWVPAESFPGREQRELVRLLQKRIKSVD